eukprot:TRINITY_DN9196_c0_g1_i1.p1 TRINITY_DN9196_c0_g1~~TRINITY_DN9196_c0_g1_i1.p1  ORF type:complete len:395 (-),score=136.72 TRINITY_DN9196_c0_g1_i1:119-1303(-)
MLLRAALRASVLVASPPPALCGTSAFSRSALLVRPSVLRRGSSTQPAAAKVEPNAQSGAATPKKKRRWYRPKPKVSPATPDSPSSTDAPVAAGNKVTPATPDPASSADAPVPPADASAAPVPKKRTRDRGLRNALGNADRGAVIAALQRLPPSRISLWDNTRILKMYANHGDLAELEAHFGATPNPDLLAFATVIRAFLRLGNLERVVHYLERMSAAGLKADEGLVADLLSSISRKPGDLPSEQRIIEFLRESSEIPRISQRLSSTLKYLEEFKARERYVRLLELIGYSPDLICLAVMIDDSAKLGDVTRAEHYFGQLARYGHQPTSTCYNCLIECYSRAGYYSKCFEVEGRMVAEGIGLDARPPSLLVVAAGHAKQPARIRELFQQYLALPGA